LLFYERYKINKYSIKLQSNPSFYKPHPLNKMNSNTVDFVNSADQTFVETVVQTVLPAETKKKSVLKTIPKKIMGYLKFAHFVLGANDETIVSKLFLDKSIDEIIAIVNDVVENGNQDKTINDLRKQLINSTKPKKTRSKKTDNADAIVTDLVTLARTDDTPAVPKKTRAKKSDTETPVVEKKVRAKKTKTPIVTADTPTDTPTETIVDTPTETPTETIVDTHAAAVAETIVDTTADTPVVEPVKKSRTKKTEPKTKKAAAPVQTQINDSLIAHSDQVSDEEQPLVTVTDLGFQTPPAKNKNNATPNAPKKN